MTDSDEKLLSRLAKDDSIAYRAIYTKYAEKLFNYAMAIFCHRETCEDIIQNVFIQLWEKRKDNNIIYLKAYLYQAVKFQIIKTFRDTKISSKDLVRLNILDTEPNASGKMEYIELESLIERLVANLSPRSRQIFIMSKFENKSIKEIAEELGLSIQTVKNQLTLATNKLRDQFAPGHFALYTISILLFSL